MAGFKKPTAPNVIRFPDRVVEFDLKGRITFLEGGGKMVELDRATVNGKPADGSDESRRMMGQLIRMALGNAGEDAE